MIFISKIISQFVKAVLALLNISDESLETSETIVASIGSFTSSDKMIRPLPIVNTYLTPNGIFFPVGNSFCVADVWGSFMTTSIKVTQNFTSWANVGTTFSNVNRVLPAGASAPFGYNQIEPIIDGGRIQGIPANSLLLTSQPVIPIEENKASFFVSGFTSYKRSFLYKGRRITLGKQFAFVSSRLNNIESLLSPGFFVYNNVAYQAYSPYERELWNIRFDMPHPFAGLTVLGKLYPATLNVVALDTALSMCEDAEGNIYSLHSVVVETSEFEPRVASSNYIVLCKNFIPVSCPTVNMLDGGVSLSTRTYTHPTLYNGKYYRKSYQDMLVGEDGQASPQIAFRDNLFISQYNKIFEINKNNFILEKIFEVPFCVTQLSANTNYLYAVHQGGVTECNP